MTKKIRCANSIRIESRELYGQTTDALTPQSTLMPRRKTSPEPEPIEGIPELDADEQLVRETTTKQTIRKERVKADPEPANPPPPARGPEPDDDDDFFIDAEPDDERPQFSESSLAALQFNDAEEIENEYCNILIRRNPDSLRDKFATPNSALLNLPTMRNVPLASERYEIEEAVRDEYGGGHYFFQIQYRGNLGKSWSASLSDKPGAGQVKTEPVAPTPIAEPAAPAANPFDQFFDNLRKQKELKELLFGDELRELERLRAEAADRQNNSTVRQSETLSILEMALRADNPTLSEKLLKIVAPEPEDTGGSHWIVDLVKTGFEHKEELAGVLQMVLGGMAPPSPAANPNIEALLRAPVPAPLAAIQPSAEPTKPATTFKRRSPAQTDETSTAGMDTDAETKTDEQSS